MFCSGKIEKIKDVQKVVESWETNEYTVGYYNGLEYALSVLTGNEPCYKMYEGGDKNEEIKEPSKRTVGGYVIRKG